MGAPKAFKDCPHCGARVKRERYDSHIKKVHEASPEKERPKGRGRPSPASGMSSRTAKKVVFFTVVCVAVVIMASVAIYFLVNRGGGGVSDNDNKEETEFTVHKISTPQGWEMYGRCYVSSPGAPLVVLVHGLNTDQSSWGLLLPHLRTAGYNVLAVDLPGHGMSTMCNGSYKSVSVFTLNAQDYEEMPGDVSKLVFRAATDRGISRDNVVVMGASIGANIGIIYASSDSDVNGLVLLSPVKQFVNDLPEDHASDLSGTPVMILVSTGDSSSINTAHTLDDKYSNIELYPYTTTYHGTNLLSGVAESIPDIKDWLGTNAPV
jgi:pimeloyl-ACP methyl ester carboxylesterase